MDMFKRLCNQNQSRKFDAMWKELDKNTRTHMKERNKKPSTDDASVLETLLPLREDIDPPNMRRRSARNIKYFSHWIEAEPKEKWSLLYDTGGARYSVMTTNIAEVYNWIIRGLRGLPIVAIIKGILYDMIGYY
ncbi:uncharacterized protein LOC133889801 [Phragmites australis]|uniref:uncharacterized protein LOC133889801 n=1 Tax=Phragmites australis TaxID=29695 RepID=UPI002D774503|nr:uncharacterized protein LOC133889801 [Phragmites australis]